MGGIVTSMAAERKDYKLLQKNTRFNLTVDQWVDPNRPMTPDELRTPHRITWPDELTQEKYFFEEDEATLLMSPQDYEDGVYDEMEEEEHYSPHRAPSAPSNQISSPMGGNDLSRASSWTTKGGGGLQSSPMPSQLNRSGSQGNNIQSNGWTHNR